MKLLPPLFVTGGLLSSCAYLTPQPTLPLDHLQALANIVANDSSTDVQQMAMEFGTSLVEQRPTGVQLDFTRVFASVNKHPSMVREIEVSVSDHFPGGSVTVIRFTEPICIKLQDLERTFSGNAVQMIVPVHVQGRPGSFGHTEFMRGGYAIPAKSRTGRAFGVVPAIGSADGCTRTISLRPGAK